MMTMISMTSMMGVAACSGPRPEVEAVRLAPAPGRAGSYLVEVSVRNRSGGEGEAKLVVRLRDPRTGEVFDGGSVSVDLSPHESARRVIEVRAPQGGRYVPEVEARYPAS